MSRYNRSNSNNHHERDEIWTSSPLDDVYSYQSNSYQRSRGGMPNSYQHQGYYSAAGSSTSYNNNCYQQPAHGNFGNKRFVRQQSQPHQPLLAAGGYHSNDSRQQPSFNKPNLNQHNPFKWNSSQPSVFSRLDTDFSCDNFDAPNYNFPPQNAKPPPGQFYGEASFGEQRGNKFGAIDSHVGLNHNKPPPASNQRPRTKYYRQLPPGGRARPGLRSFCSYTTNRQGSSKLDCPKKNLQFVYKIKACLWHRTKMGLHKKKTKISSKQWRYRQIWRNNMFCRKVHSQYWTKNCYKPNVTVKAVNPWKSTESSQEFLSLVASYAPISWQDPKHAYFHHLEYQLFIVESNGLEFLSLENQMNEWNLKVIQVVRLQNLFLFGAYMSKKQQLSANSLLLAEVIRFFCIKKVSLKELCKHGLDSRRLGEISAYPTPLEAHENRPETQGEVLMVAARVATLPVKYKRSVNDVYPEYIMDYNILNS